MNRRTICYVLVALGAGLLGLSSCNDERELLDKPIERTSNRSILNEAHARGLFLQYEEKDLLPYSRARVLDREEHRILLEFLNTEEVKNLVLRECLGNPMEKLLETRAYSALPHTLQSELRKMAYDENVLAIWKEGIAYMGVKNENTSEARQIVYSQLLSQGPQHVAGSKEVLKAFGTMALGAWTGGLPGAIAGLGAYLLSMW